MIHTPGYMTKFVPTLCGSLTASTDGASIDTRGLNAVAFVYKFGATTGTGGSVTLKLQDSANDSSFSDITDLVTPSITTNSGGATNKTVCLVVKDLRGRARYIRPVLTVTGTVNVGTTGAVAGGAMLGGTLDATLGSGSFDYHVAK